MDNATSTTQMRECAGAEFTRQDDRLNLEYQAAEDRLTPAQFSVLRQEQRGWLRRGTRCVQQDGTNGPVSFTVCRSQEAADRADYLSRYDGS